MDPAKTAVKNIWIFILGFFLIGAIHVLCFGVPFLDTIIPMICGTLSLSSFGEIGPGIGLSETVAAAAGAVREAVEDVFLGGPGVASPSDAFRASAGDASPSAATDPDASQFDAEGMLIDGIALIDDISTPSDALMMMAAPKLLKAPPSAADPDMAALFTALSEVCEAWDGGDVIIAEDLSDCGVKSEDVNEYFEIFIHAYPEFFFLSHQLPEWKVPDGVVSRMELYTLAGEVSAADAAYFDEVVSEITEGIPEGADAELAALYLCTQEEDVLDAEFGVVDVGIYLDVEHAVDECASNVVCALLAIDGFKHLACQHVAAYGARHLDLMAFQLALPEVVVDVVGGLGL